MYLSFFGLSRPPFAAEPPPEPLFDNPAHVDAVWNIIYGITEDRGFVMVTGERGIGKSAVLNAAARSLAATHPSLLWVVFPDPSILPAAILEILIDRLNLATALTVDGDLRPLRNRLLRLREGGKRLVMIFDDAQELPPETLAFLCVLAELDRGETPIFLTVLSGRTGLDTLIGGTPYQALARRLGVRIVLTPLPPQRARDYIQYRLAQAGGDMPEIMTASALQAIVRHAQGNPGRIHLLADGALRNGFATGRRPITAREVKAAPAESGLPAQPQPSRNGPAKRAVLLGLGASCLAAALVALMLVAKPGPTRPVAAVIPSPPPPRTSSVLAALPAPTPKSVAAKPRPPAVSAALPPPVARPRNVPPATPAMETHKAVPPPPGIPATVAIRLKRGDNILTLLHKRSLPSTAAALRRIKNLNPAIGNLSLVYPGEIVILPVR